MTIAPTHGRYHAALARTSADVLACQALRHRCFFGQAGLDRDDFDPRCDHMMVMDLSDGRLVATFRLLHIAQGRDIQGSYAAQYYDLAAFSHDGRRAIEIGRFCCDPSCMSPDILRKAWAALTVIVDTTDTALLFGCTSFKGIDPAPYARAFGLLGQRYAAPQDLRPGVKAPQIVTFADYAGAVGAGAGGDGMVVMPPLLRTYLAMGGWVSDHAVVDRAMNTLHVFTGLAVAAVPPARAKALRRLAK